MIIAIQSGTQFKENRSYDANCNNLLKKSVSSSNHRLSKHICRLFKILLTNNTLY